jgi:hypothetical protein
MRQSECLMYNPSMPFHEYAAKFIAIGFIAGSIVHLGEGVNLWDILVLALGIVLFLWTSVKSAALTDFDTPLHRIRFIALSFLLAVGIGMASGGFQHFTDTPEYSAVLIPVGLLIGYMAYERTQGKTLGVRRIISIVAGALVLGLFMNWLGHVLVDFDLAVPHTH